MATPRIIELDEAVSRIKQACEDQDLVRSPFFFMVGAGISCPSVPIATDVISHCKEESSRHGRNVEPPPSKDVKKDSGDQLDDYSHWFQSAYGEPMQRQGYLQKLIEGKPITHANFRLAHLLLNDTISNIVVTTNFDDFLSKALTLFGKPHIVCDHPRTVGRIQLTRSIVQIIHLHGTYWFYDCCNLRGELENRALHSQQSITTMASLLDRIMGERSPLVTGYSGWESDVFMSSLKRRLEATDPPGTNVYWFCYQRSQVDEKPDWLKKNPNVRFVVPPAKATETESSAPGGTEQIGSTSIQKIAEQNPIERKGEPRLPSDTVLDRLIKAFDPIKPKLTSDPLGFFAEHLERSLPTGDASEADVYTIKSIIDRVKRAKETELEYLATAAAAEQALEQIREALRGADYREVIRCGKEIQLERLSATELHGLSDAIWSTASGLIDPSEKISAYDLVIAISDRLLGLPNAETVQISRRAAISLFNKAVTLADLNRNEEAIAVYDEVVIRYGAAAEHDLREQAAIALNNKGFVLFALNRRDEAITVYDELVKRYAEATEPALRTQVAKALNNKAVTFGQLNSSEKAITVYDEVVKLYGGATEPALREQVAIALNNKGLRLDDLNRSEQAISAYDEVVKLYGEATESALRKQVAITLNNKGFVLVALNRRDEAITVYDELVKRYAEATEPALRSQVSKALNNKAVTFGQLNRAEEEITVYDEVVKLYGAATELALREQVAIALNNKGFRLDALNRSDQAIVAYDEVVKSYGAATEPALREQVAITLNNKGVALGQLNRREESIAVFDEILRLYGDATEPALRVLVAIALNNKGLALSALSHREEAVKVHDDVVKRFVDSTEPKLREQVAAALNNISFANIVDAKGLRLTGNKSGAAEKLARARESVRAALSLEPEDPVKIGNQAYIAFLEGRKEEARELLTRAISLGGEDTKRGELGDADINRLPEDDEFCEMVNSIEVINPEGRA